MVMVILFRTFLTNIFSAYINLLDDDNDWFDYDMIQDDHDDDLNEAIQQSAKYQPLHNIVPSYVMFLAVLHFIILINGNIQIKM